MGYSMDHIASPSQPTAHGVCVQLPGWCSYGNVLEFHYPSIGMGPVTSKYSHIGDATINQKYVEKENEVLALLNQEEVSAQLYPFTVEMIKPGALLVYPLVGADPLVDKYGCHIIRDPKAGYKYLEGNDMRGGVAANLFLTLPEELWKNSLKQLSGTLSRTEEMAVPPLIGT